MSTVRPTPPHLIALSRRPRSCSGKRPAASPRPNINRAVCPRPLRHIAPTSPRGSCRRKHSRRLTRTADRPRRTFTPVRLSPTPSLTPRRRGRSVRAALSALSGPSPRVRGRRRRRTSYGRCGARNRPLRRSAGAEGVQRVRVVAAGSVRGRSPTGGADTRYSGRSFRG
jgi:hypothetical protein